MEYSENNSMRTHRTVSTSYDKQSFAKLIEITNLPLRMKLIRFIFAISIFI
jgi:hypothetical protein